MDYSFKKKVFFGFFWRGAQSSWAGLIFSFIDTYLRNEAVDFQNGKQHVSNEETDGGKSQVGSIEQPHCNQQAACEENFDSEWAHKIGHKHRRPQRIGFLQYYMYKQR